MRPVEPRSYPSNLNFFTLQCCYLKSLIGELIFNLRFGRFFGPTNCEEWLFAELESKSRTPTFAFAAIFWMLYKCQKKNEAARLDELDYDWTSHVRHLPPAKLKEKSYPVFLWNRPGPVIAGHSLTEQLPIESGNSPDPWQSSPNPVKERPSLKKGTTSTTKNKISVFSRKFRIG